MNCLFASYSNGVISGSGVLSGNSEIFPLTNSYNRTRSLTAYSVDLSTSAFILAGCNSGFSASTISFLAQIISKVSTIPSGNKSPGIYLPPLAPSITVLFSAILTSSM